MLYNSAAHRAFKIVLRRIANILQGKKNMLGKAIKPSMCKTCPNILGVDAFHFSNNICEKCSSPAPLLPARDKTEALLRSAFSGSSRERMIERHRKERHDNEIRYSRVIKKNEEVVKSADNVMKKYGGQQ